jgi:hypothetical protein
MITLFWGAAIKFYRVEEDKKYAYDLDSQFRNTASDSYSDPFN